MNKTIVGVIITLSQLKNGYNGKTIHSVHKSSHVCTIKQTKNHLSVCTFDCYAVNIIQSSQHVTT